MKKYLFPFSHKYADFSKYWWHRFLIVVFILSILFVGVYVWQSLNQYELNGLSNCNQLGLSSSSSSESDAIVYQQCSDIYPIHSLLNFGSGLLSSIILFYFLQFIYFKVILYVVYGNKK